MKAETGELSFGKMHRFPYWEAEHKACREGVILMDMSFMCKFLVQGRDAGRALNYISANNVDDKLNTITYTQWLNQDRINIQGPKSLELLQTLTTVDLSNEAFPFRHAQEIEIGYARVLCIRITYLGELGYELYIPSEQATHVYDLIVEAGKAFDLKHAGLKALASLRMEKGYKDYGHDIDNTDNAFETGLGFAVDFKKESFIGRDKALEQKSATPYSRRLVQVLIKDPEALLYHAEVVRRNGVSVGYVRAGSYGHTLGGTLEIVRLGPKGPVTVGYLKVNSLRTS